MRTLQQFNVRLKHADGMSGLPEAGPFDSIIVAAAGEGAAGTAPAAPGARWPIGLASRGGGSILVSLSIARGLRRNPA